VRESVKFSISLASESGLLGLIAEHSSDLFEALTVEGLPRQEIELLQPLGIDISQAQLESTVRSIHEKRKTITTEIKQDGITQKVEEIDRELKIGELKTGEKKVEEKRNVAERPKRKWFKGVSLILIGSGALTANVLSTTTMLGAPFILSATSGVGSMIAGLGALKGES